jgi:hypothetical protein
MLYTTFRKLHEHGACKSGYAKLSRSLGGVNKYGEDTLISLDKIIESNGLHDTIWALRALIKPADDLLIEFACRCAEHVLHFYEDKYPDDKRPRKAIEAARVCITDKSQEAIDARDAAGDAAWDAAGDAAWAAAWAARAARDAAWAAAWAAARAAAKSARDAAWADAGAARAAESALAAARAAAAKKGKKIDLVKLAKLAMEKTH